VARHNAAPFRFNYLLLAEILGLYLKEIKRFSKPLFAELSRSVNRGSPSVARVLETRTMHDTMVERLRRA
jgi:hypothetical protein